MSMPELSFFYAMVLIISYSDNYYDFETNEEAAMTSVNNINGVINILFYKLY
jgi:hypothetical protein